MQDKVYTLPQADAELESLVGADLGIDSHGDVHIGALVEGHVTSSGPGGLTLRLPGDSAAAVNADEIDATDEKALPSVGDTVPFVVESLDNDGRWIGSIDRARRLQTFKVVEEAAAKGEPITATVTVAMRNGLAADFHGFRCFVPRRESGVIGNEGLSLVGKQLTFDVRHLERKSAQLVLSRRARAEKERAERESERIAELEVGQIVEGRVRNLLDFGAFVDVGGIDGLLHVSEISNEHITHPSEALTVGDTVRVAIESLDADKRKVGLTRRPIIDNERRQLLDTIAVDSIHEGVVRNLTDFGAFVEVAEGVEGLCHISEISWTERYNHASEALEQGQAVRVRVLKKDPETLKLSLSIRQVEENPWSEFLDANPAGETVSGTITRIEDYGIFVELAEGIEGLVHVSEITWEGRPETPSDAGDFEIGQSIEARLLEADINRQRISLGIKQLSGDPWDDAEEQLVVGAIYEARVTRFGNDVAWLQIAPGVEGRLHISEISRERVDSLRSALRIGQDVQVMTTRVERNRRQIDVSVKAIEEKELREQPSSFEDEGSMNTLATAFAESGLVAPLDSNEEPAAADTVSAENSTDAGFASDADLLAGMKQAMAGLKPAESPQAEAERAEEASTDNGSSEEPATTTDADTPNTDTSDDPTRS